jgi:hypothetical protein
MSSAQKTIDHLTKRIPASDIPFSIQFPSGEKLSIGRGGPEFQLSFRNSRSVGLLRTLTVIMGTLGHFPLNARVLDTIYNLLKFGGRVYLDERIATKTFMSQSLPTVIPCSI